MGAETKQKQPGDKAEDGVIQPERKQQPSTCQVCQLQPHKYRCPGCQLQTCSLACSQQHKQQNGCSGKRDKLAFVPMSQFNDKHLMSDYRWLEEVSRADDNARRLRPPTPRRELPQHLASLVHQARLRGVRLLIMPPGMQRRQCNSTRYEFRARKLAWRLEWRFPAAAAAAAGAPQAAAGSNTAQAAVAATADAAQPSADAQPSPAAAAAPSSSSSSSLRIVDGRVDEDALLCDVLGGHLQYQPGAGGQALLLRQHRQAGLGSLTVLMRKERCPANAVQYYQLDLQQCLKSQLAGKTVIEFPTLLVLLPSEVAAYSIITPEQQQAEQAAYRQGRQQLQHWPPPPPPPPRKPAAAGQQEQESAGALQTVGEQQQQQQEPPPAEGDEPPAKRQCNGSRSAADTVANSEQGAVQDKEPQSQQQQPQQQQQQQVADIPSEEQQQEQPSQDQQQQQQQQQPTYYYYDPADGVDEDAADLLAGLEDDDEEQQQQQVQVRQRAAAAAGGVVLGGEEGRAAMMQLLGQYDEHEIDLDE